MTKNKIRLQYGIIFRDLIGTVVSPVPSRVKLSDGYSIVFEEKYPKINIGQWRWGYDYSRILGWKIFIFDENDKLENEKMQNLIEIFPDLVEKDYLVCISEEELDAILGTIE